MVVPLATVTAMSENNQTQHLNFQAEVQQLLNILAHSLYSDREVFLRELLSNASDALHRIQFESLTNRDVRDADTELSIHIAIDNEAGTITIEDTGIGMTQEELVQNLGTIAHSGVREFAKKLEAEKREGLIGNFGVGFYSAFVIADDVTVTSLSYRPEAQPAQWHSTGDGTFDVGPGQREKRGTVIRLKVKEDAREFLNESRLSTIIRKHSSFITFPLYVGTQRINEDQGALWRREPRELKPENYTEFYQQLTFDFQDPLTQAHIATESPVDLHALLFVPSSRTSIERGDEQKGKIKLFSRRILIREDASDLLPQHFRFISGIVDSDDIPLSVSRESAQTGPVITKLKTVLNSRVRKALTDLAANDAEKYGQFWREFGVFLKEGIARDPSTVSDLAPLLRFDSSQVTDKLISLSEYKAAMPEDQKEILYLFGQNIEGLRQSPHLEGAGAGRNVLLMGDVVDAFMLVSLREFEGLKLTSLEDGEADAKSGSDENAAALAPLIALAKEALGDQVSDVRATTKLQNHPVRLVNSVKGGAAAMERAYRMLGRDYPASPKVLEINATHPIIQKLADGGKSPDQAALIKDVIEQLHAHAQLQDGVQTSPNAMISRIERLITAALAHTAG